MTDTLERQIVELYSTGMSTRTIASQTGLSKTAILRVMHQAGVTLRQRGHQPASAELSKRLHALGNE